ncbi:23S rRNA (uracil1939-C5)-methyltransferase [Candidatus Gastranaerophilus sp. (ex Termes propinquus)]|nr:23S rRNA (uracil1939-C5)-methyltransferase [Candidatus Gastranaerophilus sp. (ex Termes propinquus)]
MKGGDILDLKVEKLTYKGAGLAKVEGFAVFVKGSCPGDLLRVQIVKANKNFATARILEILEPSEHRVKPFCPLFNACGSCHWQFVDYDFALLQKQLIIKEALRGEYSVPPVLKSPKTQEYRFKAQCPVGETKVSKRLLVGYFKEGSHEITDIKYCPIQPRVFDEIFDYVRKNWTLGAYNEKTGKGLLRHAVLRGSSASKKESSALLTLVLNSDKLFQKQREEIEKFLKGAPLASGCSINYNPKKTNTIFGDKFEHISGAEHILEKIKSKSYIISPQSFFQINPSAAAVLFDEVKKHIKQDSSVLDAYGGVGAFGIWVSDIAKNIVLVEESEQAVKNAKENFKLNECKSYEVFLGNAKERFKEFSRNKRFFDHVILDPPRSGCEREVLEVLSTITNSVIYVSCNPQTLARDVKILEGKGLECETVQGVDMFPHTYHIECVANLVRRA